MSLPIYQRVAVTDAGDVIPGAEYTVINENTGVAAPIYSDRTGATLLSAPYFADSAGTIQFYIAQGTTFRVAASGGVGTYTDRYIYAAHPQSSPTDTTAGSLMAVGAFGLGTKATGGISSADYNVQQGSGLSYKSAAAANGPTTGGAFAFYSLEFPGATQGVFGHLNVSTDGVAYMRGVPGGAWNKIITANAAGNVGINTSSPISKLHVDGAEDGTGGITLSAGAQNHQWFLSSDVVNVHNIATGSGGAAHTWQMGGVEKMRIDATGKLLVNITNPATGFQFQVDAGSGNARFTNVNTGGSTFDVFRFNGGLVGSITTNGTSTSYNTSSDYRLKENDVPMTGATERVKALRPINFAWKAGGSRVDGFFAHELAEVVPEAATGTKDAMRDEEYEVTPAVYEDVTIPAVEAVLDEDGMVITEAVEESTESVLVTEAVMGTRSVPDYQGIDQSKLVPLLTATIQELIARIEALEAGA